MKKDRPAKTFSENLCLSTIRFAASIILLSSLSVACSTEQANPPSSDIPVSVSDYHFSEAVKQATEAAQLSQAAKTPDEWLNISKMWAGASTAMTRVGKSHPRYDLAQTKAAEYKANQESAELNHFRFMPDEEVYNALRGAVHENRIPVIKTIVKSGFDVNYSSQEYVSHGEPYRVLEHAATFSSEKTVDALLDAGARWDLIPKAALGDALIGASCNGESGIVSKLLSASADPNHSTAQETPLIVASGLICIGTNKTYKTQEDYDKVISLLRQAGAQ